MGLVVTPKNCDVSVKKAIQQLSRMLAHASVYSFTASRLLASDTNGAFSSVADFTDWIAGTANEITVTDDGDGTVTLSIPSGAAITFSNTGLHILDSNASHDLIIKPGSDLTADRELTITTGDAARTITLSGNPTLNDWFDQNVKSGTAPTFTADNLSDGGGNAIITTAQETNFEAGFTHVSNDGSDHSFIDQNITTSGSPTFAGLTQIGDASNKISVSSTGDLLFHGTGGLAFGEIFAKDNSTTTSVSSGGWTQITIFDTNGVSNNTTPDHTNDHITITQAGMYMATISIVVENNAGAGHAVEFSLYKNNGASEFTNVHAHRTLSAGTDKGSVSLSGIVDLAVNDTIELWATSDSGTAKNITVSDVTLSLIQNGGT
jgi:hypothetical protein